MRKCGARGEDGQGGRRGRLGLGRSGERAAYRLRWRKRGRGSAARGRCRRGAPRRRIRAGSSLVREVTLGPLRRCESLFSLGSAESLPWCSVQRRRQLQDLPPVIHDPRAEAEHGRAACERCGSSMQGAAYVARSLRLICPPLEEGTDPRSSRPGGPRSARRSARSRSIADAVLLDPARLHGWPRRRARLHASFPPCPESPPSRGASGAQTRPRSARPRAREISRWVRVQA